MVDVVVIGAGVVGQCAAMLLAADGHRVTVLERDPAPPPTTPDDAWSDWERRGVNQFRMIHYFLPRFREILERELPDVARELEADGAIRFNPLRVVPEQISGGLRDGDERYDALTGRRPMVEAAIARVAGATDGVVVRRGVAVKGLLVEDDGAPVPHVTGVMTGDGEEVRGGLVVDAGGRRSPITGWLTSIGARPPAEEREECGFVYFARHFASDDGSLPALFGPPLQHYDSISALTLPADNGTWGLGLSVSAADPELRALRDPEIWTNAVRSFPLIAHWLDGEPISDVAVMAGIEDRHRAFMVDDAPVATGVVAVGDAWACTNPSVGRGATIGLLHARALRDHLRDCPLDDHEGFARAWHEQTGQTVEPFFRDTLASDRHRLAEIGAQIAGEPYVTDDRAWILGKALGAASGQDPDLFRAVLDIASVYAHSSDVFGRPGLAARALELGGGPDAGALPGPSRAELLAIVRA
jgi:flavin-dependent dehydrogenase